MSEMTSVEVQHHLTSGPSTAEPKQKRSVSSMPKNPGESNTGNQSSAQKDTQESEKSSKSKLKDPPPSSTMPSSSNEPSQDETRDADEDQAAAPNTATPSSAAATAAATAAAEEESSCLKPPPINLHCEEEMPAFFDFSDLPNPPSLNLLPHVVLTLSYVAINQLLGENSSPRAAKTRALNRQRKCPQVLVGVAPALEKLGTRLGTKSKALEGSSNSNKQLPVKKKSPTAKVLKNMKETVRLKALGIPTEPIERDIPLSYDWSSKSSLQLGSKTGSKAWNRILVQQTIRHLQETGAGLAEVMTYRVPQVNAVETLVALQENLSRITSAPGSFPPPPFYEFHKKTASAASATVPSKRPTIEDGVLIYTTDQMSRLYDSLKKKESDSSTYQTEISMRSADDVIRLLQQFHEKAQDLDRRYETLLDNIRDESASPSKSMNSTKAADATGVAAAVDAEPMEIDKPTAQGTTDATTAAGDVNKKDDSLNSMNVEKPNDKAPNGMKHIKKANGTEQGKKKSTSGKDEGPEPMDVDVPEQNGKREKDDATEANTKSASLEQPKPQLGDPEAWRENIRKFMAEQEPSAPRYLHPHDRP